MLYLDGALDQRSVRAEKEVQPFQNLRLYSCRSYFCSGDVAGIEIAPIRISEHKLPSSIGTNREACQLPNQDTYFGGNMRCGVHIPNISPRGLSKEREGEEERVCMSQ